jgi:hypothetical protein
VRRWLFVAAAGAAVAGAAVLAGAAGGDEAADGYALFLGAVGMLWLVRRTRRASGADMPSAYDRAVAARRAPRPSRPATLERVEREVVLSSGSAFDLHVRLRARLRAIADHRLAAHRGLELDAGTAETRDLLGEDFWELVRPDRPMPTDRLAPGLPVRRQRDLLDRVERI